MWFKFPDWRDKITHIGTDYIDTYQLAAVFLDLKHVVKNLRCEEVKHAPSHRPLKINGAAKKYSTRDLVILIILGDFAASHVWLPKGIRKISWLSTSSHRLPAVDFDPCWGSPNNKASWFRVIHYPSNSAKTWIWWHHQSGGIYFSFFPSEKTWKEWIWRRLMVISRGFLDVSGLGGLPLYLPRGSADGTIRIWECTRKRQLKAGNSGRHPCWLMIVGGIILPYIYIYVCVCWVGIITIHYGNPILNQAV